MRGVWGKQSALHIPSLTARRQLSWHLPLSCGSSLSPKKAMLGSGSASRPQQAAQTQDTLQCSAPLSLPRLLVICGNRASSQPLKRSQADGNRPEASQQAKVTEDQKPENFYFLWRESSASQASGL